MNRRTFFAASAGAIAAYSGVAGGGMAEPALHLASSGPITVTLPRLSPGCSSVVVIPDLARGTDILATGTDTIVAGCEKLPRGPQKWTFTPAIAEIPIVGKPAEIKLAWAMKVEPL